MRVKKPTQFSKGTTKSARTRKMLAEHFSSSSLFRPTQSLTRGINRQLYCTGVITYGKTRQLFLFLLTKKGFGF